MRLIYRSSQSQKDILEIAAYIAVDNLAAAEKWALTLDQNFVILAEKPNMGRNRPELARQLKSWPYGQYVIYYRARPDGIEVIRVLHGARKISRHQFRPQS